MKKQLVLVALCGFVFTGCSVNDGSEGISTPPVSEMHADFPFYDINQMVEGHTDLVVVTHVESVNEVNDGIPGDPEASHKEAVLHVEDIFFGQLDQDKIILYQSVDRVTPNQTYLLFLSYRPEIDMYVVSDGASQTLVPDIDKLTETEKELVVKVKGIEGEYTRDELKSLFEDIANKDNN